MRVYLESKGVSFCIDDNKNFIYKRFDIYIPYIQYQHLNIYEEERSLMIRADSIFLIAKSTIDFVFTFKILGFGLGFKYQWGY